MKPFKRPLIFIVSAALLFFLLRPCPFTHASVFIEPFDFSADLDPDAVSAILSDIKQKTLNAGVPNLIPYSLVLIDASRRAREAREYEKAVILADCARSLSPDLPPAYLAAARTRWSSSPLSVHRLISGRVLSAAASVRSLPDLCFALFVNFSSLGLAVMFTLSVCTSIWLFRYTPLLYHDLRYKSPDGVPDSALAGFMILLFVFPVFLNLSLIWLFVYWSLLLYTYHYPRERWVAAGLVALVILVMPILTAAVSAGLSVPQSERMMLLWKGNYGYCSLKDRENLEECGLRNPENIDLDFTLGLVHKREQNYVTALGYYDRVLSAQPRHVKALVNSGNVYLATEQWESAVDRYKEALSLEPENAAAHFNLARAYQQQFMFAEAEQELARAKKFGSELTDYYLEIYSENYNRLVIDIPLDRTYLYRKGVDAQGLFDTEGKNLWNVFFSGLPLPFGPVAVLFLFIANWFWYRKDRLRIAVSCSVCGKPICRRCEKNVSGDVICAQCMTFLNKHDKLGFKEKETKTQSIRRYLRRYKYIGSLLSTMIPGAGHVWKGRPIQGTLIMLLFWTLIFRTGFALFCEGPWEFAVPSEPGGVLMLVGAAAVSWIVLARIGLQTEGHLLRDNLALRYLSLDRE